MLGRVNDIDSTGVREGAHPRRVPRPVGHRFAKEHAKSASFADAQRNDDTSTSTIAGERLAAHPLHAPHADAARTPGTAGRHWRRWAPPDLPRLTKNIPAITTEIQP